MLTVNPSTYVFEFQNGLEIVISLFLLSCFIWGSKRNCNTEVVQSSAALNTALVKKIMWYLFSFPSTNHPNFCHLYSLLQVSTLVKKYNIVQVKVTCGLGSKVSEEYTACVCRRLSEDGGSLFIGNSIQYQMTGCLWGSTHF